MIKYHIIKKNERKLFHIIFLFSCFLFSLFHIFLHIKYAHKTKTHQTYIIYCCIRYNNVMFDELPSIFQKIIFLEKTHGIKR